MMRARSIKARLSLVFLLLFLLVILIGFEALRSLNYVNDASSQIRVRWLPSTRVLGDLNNYTTDFPAAETALSHAARPGERAEIERQMAHLDREIAAAQRAYRQISHDPTETQLYGRFAARWSEYRQVVERSASSSKAAYDAASEALGTLTERNIASAREASERTDLAYAQARGRIGLTILLV